MASTLSLKFKKYFPLVSLKKYFDRLFVIQIYEHTLSLHFQNSVLSVYLNSSLARYFFKGRLSKLNMSKIAGREKSPFPKTRTRWTGSTYYVFTAHIGSINFVSSKIKSVSGELPPPDFFACKGLRLQFLNCRVTVGPFTEADEEIIDFFKK